MNKYWFDLWDEELEYVGKSFIPGPSTIAKKINTLTVTVQAKSEQEAIIFIEKNCARQFKKLFRIDLQNE